jgi:G3E family GTPase
LGEDDERSITDLLIEQVEFADVILISKIDLISQRAPGADCDPERLNAQAEIIPMIMGEVPLAKSSIPDVSTSKKRPRRRAGCRNYAANVPETEEYGIASTAYRARRPFPSAALFRLHRPPVDQWQAAALKGFLLAGEQTHGRR